MAPSEGGSPDLDLAITSQEILQSCTDIQLIKASSEGDVPARWTFTTMLNQGPPIPPTKLKRMPTVVAKSAPAFNGMPTEIKHHILKSLDILSLTRFAAASSGTMEVVQSLPAYRDLTKLAPGLLKGLAYTKFLHVHSAGDLYEQFASQECTSCGAFGAFLFIPTAQRCCYRCLQFNVAFWVLPLRTASLYYSLPQELAEELPAMVCGRYHDFNQFLDDMFPKGRIFRWLSVLQAREAGIALHGSAEEMAAVTQKNYPYAPGSFPFVYRNAQDRQLDLKECVDTWSMKVQAAGITRQDLERMPSIMPASRFRGMGSIRFDYLVPSEGGPCGETTLTASRAY